jgi:hypothetical protein
MLAAPIAAARGDDRVDFGDLAPEKAATAAISTSSAVPTKVLVGSDRHRVGHLLQQPVRRPRQGAAMATPTMLMASTWTSTWRNTKKELAPTALRLPDWR